MKINKNIFICALLVLVMLCVIGSASAEEPLNENLTATDTGGVIDDDVNEKISISDSEDELGGAGDTITVDCNGNGDYMTISEAVGAATGGETIFIKNGEYTEARIADVDKKLSFVGESQDGVIIKSSVANGFFYTSKSDYELFTFSKLTFKDINAGNIGTIFIGGNGNVKITDCTFDNCKSKYGAIRIYTSGIVNIENSRFVNCNSTSTGGASAIDLAGSGTAPFTIKNVYVENSKAPSNNLGVVYLDSNTHDFIIDNITIINSSGNVLAAVYTKGNLNITNSTIASNNFTRSGCGIFYIGGKDKKITAESNMISSNSADYVLTSNTQSTMSLNYNNVQNNNYANSFVGSASTAPTCNLDANYWGSNSLPQNVTASTWIVEENGVYKLNTGEELDVTVPGLNDGEEPIDAIYVSADGNDANDGSINSPVFNITKAVELAKAGSGNIIIKEGTYNQSDITIDDSITIIGEGNVVIDGTGLAKASVFTVTTANVTIKNIKFTNVNARNGGALSIQGSSQSDLLDINVLVENCSFDNIKAGRGGAIYAYYTKGKLAIANSNFTNMDLTWGAVCAYQSSYGDGLSIEISKSIFANNKGNNGAALYLQASYLTLTECEIYNNTAAQSPGAISLTNITATLDNCKIYNNSALKEASAIAVYAGKISSNPTVLKPSQLTITNCIIENNTATQEGAAAIYLENSKMDISYSSIVNALNIHNTVTANYDNDKPQAVTANNNWWGVDDPKTTVQGDNITIDNWVIMNLEANVTEVLVGDTVELTVDFNHVNTTSGEIEELTGGAIPKTFTVTFTSDSGSIEPSTVDVSKGTSKKVIYTVADVDAVISAQTGENIKTISFAKGVEPYYGVIYVSKDGDDNNNGSELYPVASIGKAVELALVSGGSGQIIINEGTYAGTGYHVTGNLTVTGVGNVILDGEGQGRLFYMDYGDSVDKMHIANLTIVNVKHNYGAAVYSNAKELILENLTISSAPETGNLIYNTGKMTIKDSEIKNHNGGNVITTSGNYDLIINNTVFTNNTVIASNTDFGIVYISSGRGNLYIENSKFYNSTTRQGVIVSANSDKNIYVTSSEFINNHMQDTYASGGAISVNNKLEVTDSIFIDNTACGDGGAISIGRFGDATITKSVFINNAAGNGKRGDAIYNGKKLKINYCLLISNGANKVIYHNGEDNDADAQYNWWGTNDDPQNLVGVGTYEDDDWNDVNCVIDTSNWVVMTVSNNYTDQINVGDKVEFTVDFTHTNSGQALADSIPEVKVNASALYGQMNPEHAKTENNVAKFVYTATEGGEDNVTISSSNAVNVTAVSVKVPVVLEVIYVSMSGDDNNNGARDTPVATLKHAIEIAEKGKIVIMNGDYTITETLKVDKDLDITGMGTVTINGNELGILENSANLNLTNIVFTNAKLATGSVLKDSGNTTIEGCTFYSCITTGTSSSGPINNMKGTMIINNSKFYQNRGARGVVASSQGTRLIINNSEFYDNDCTTFTNSYGIIYITSADAIVENTVFRNNKVKNGAGIYATKSTSATTGSLEATNCTFKDNVAKTGSGAGVFISGPISANIKDSTFINNLANASASNVGGNGGAIYTGTSGTPKITIVNSIFINNSGNNPNYGDAGINVGAGTFDMSNCVILAKDGDTNFALNAAGATVTANDNFWGDNAKANTNANVARWIMMNASYTKDDQGVLTITATFDKTNSTSGEIADYAGSIPDGFDVTFTSTSGKLNEVVAVKNAQAIVQYTLDKKDSAITVKVANAEVTFPFEVAPEVIYVSPAGDDTNNGERETPVATLQHALEIAENGKIVILNGTYKTGYLGIISSDLNITGEGKVVIDADNNNRILYVGENAKVILKNLIMINGLASASSEESGALLGNNGDLTLINCTLADSKSEKNGGAIYNARSLTVINSTFENNVAEKNGGAIFTQKSGMGIPTLTVSNSIFKNNTAKGVSNYGGGAIYVQQAADGVLIENSLFVDNKCYDYGGGAIEIAQTNAATINNSTFINNGANGQDDMTTSNYGGGAVSFKGQYDSSSETLTITNSLFIDNYVNECGGGAVFVMYSTVDIHNSVLINNGDKNGVSIYGRNADMAPAKITANDNWWGSNDSPKSSINRGTLTRWAILTITNDTPIVSGNTVKLTVSINSCTDGTENATLANPINVERPVSIRTTSGVVDGVLVNGEFSYDYLVPANLKIISATVDDQTEILFVIASETVLGVDNISACQGETVNVNITVKTTEGADVTGGTVELYFGDELVATIPVIDGVASKDIIVAKDVGTYAIKANYTDSTGEFSYSEAAATLNVTGVNNIVTPGTFSMFFDENGNLKSDLPFDELYFEGTFENMGVITIGKSIKLTGRNAQFKDTAFKLDADNVVLNEVSVELTKNFDKTDGAAIYVGGNNVTVSNNNITYNAPDNVQSYAIQVDVAENVKIINNNINYTAKSDGTVKTIAINAHDSNGLVVENNVLNANIPSVDLDYSAYPIVGYNSQGVHIEKSNNVAFDKNRITVSYGNVQGYYDTIYGVHIENSNNSRVTDNGIELNGHQYAYALVTNNCGDITISGNDIKSNSDDHYAAGLQVGGKSTASVDNNNVSAKSKDVVYPVYLDDWYNGGEVNLTNNTIKGESDTVYGVYAEEDKVLISENTIEAEGNHVYGVVTHQTDVVIDANNITANGRDVGAIVSPQSGVNENTTGIIVSEGQAEITNNNVVTTGKSTIAAINTNATVKNNGLTANQTTAENSISSVNSTVVASGNTAAKGNETPTTPVVKITGKNNAKVDYGFKYSVRVTIDGKSVGAGKAVTLKIAGKTLKAKTDKNGYAKFTLAVKPKSYTVTVKYGKVSQKYKITVKNVIKAKNLKVKKSAKKHKAKTNKKGVATFKVKKNLLKKLKAGKKYKYQVIYGKDTVKKTLKVKK